MLRRYFMGGVIAIIVSLVITFILWIFSLVSWAIIVAVISFFLTPLFIKMVEFYEEHNCYNLDSLSDELHKAIEKYESKSSRESKIEL